ncbi:MAG: bifunctional pyr operon transcriptional regulator/uracil phosphoribosyltransferase PyrR [Candidatus Omnitrophica bacterium]|nr:bifunctional pyr operon transcriptional regulator/uracil phosphoribosyltransferase PyrR [Candidatus Omnitrophota bacterium]
MPEKKVLDQEGIDRAVIRIAHEILERNHGTKNLVLLGIRSKGVFLAERLRRQIRTIENVEVPLGTLDITFYRDDLKRIGPHPTVRETQIPFDLTGKLVVLVDDVLYTGRTIRAALDAIIDFGRPDAVQLAVLIDRGHRELPIKADYVGKNIPTSQQEDVAVQLSEENQTDEVVVREEKKNG